MTRKLLGAALAGCALLAAAPVAAQDGQADPVARPAMSLDTAATLTRIAFGSCNRQDQDQGFWAGIADLAPQLFMMIGDNVYGDRGWKGDPGLASFRVAYAVQASHPQFRTFRSKVPMLATWDDHDFGPNDGGGDFAYKQASERLFETFWGSADEVRGRPGVYQSVMVGPPERRVQLILLDTRYFRSPLKGPKGNYLPDDDPAAQLLGAAQWDWLEGELAKPAELRLVASSIQVISQSHRWEKWANQPLQRDRLFDALAARAGGGVVLLTGDRHSGGIYSVKPDGTGEVFWEITASSFNAAFAKGDVSKGEPDPLRRSMLWGGENFGLVDIDWARRAAIIRLVSTGGYEIAAQEIAF